jgi:hypothetical protein
MRAALRAERISSDDTVERFFDDGLKSTSAKGRE